MWVLRRRFSRLVLQELFNVLKHTFFFEPDSVAKLEFSIFPAMCSLRLLATNTGQSIGNFLLHKLHGNVLCCMSIVRSLGMKTHCNNFNSNIPAFHEGHQQMICKSIVHASFHQRTSCRIANGIENPFGQLVALVQSCTASHIIHRVKIMCMRMC